MWEKGQHKCCPGIKRKIFKRNNTCTSSQYDFILEQQPVPSSLFSKFNIVPDQKCFMSVYIIILADTLPGMMCLMGNSYSITHVCLYYYFKKIHFLERCAWWATVCLFRLCKFWGKTGGGNWIIRICHIVQILCFEKVEQFWKENSQV